MQSKQFLLTIVGGLGVTYCELFKDRSNSRQYFIDNNFGKAFESFSTARGEIKSARLIATNDTGCL